MFDAKDYNVEGAQFTLREGAMLYRLASLSHCTADVIVNGMAASQNARFGRFNAPHQRATYCANNVLVCISEVMFHMYRTLLDRIRDKRPTALIRAAAHLRRCLVIFRMKEIEKLVCLDSEDIRTDYDGRITGTTVVFPDAEYGPFRDLNNRFRMDGKAGVAYPSARHSRDLCIVFFADNTTSVRKDIFENYVIELRIVVEDQDIAQPPETYDPFVDRAHPTMGYYKVIDHKAFSDAQKRKLVNPIDLPTEGMVDFVRRRYVSYPKDAVCV